MGESLSGVDGRWLQGGARLTAGRRIRTAALRGEASVFGLGYLEPFTYDAGGLRLESSLSVPVGPVSVAIAPTVTAGSWSTDALEGDLRVAGGHLEIEAPLGGLSARATAGALRVDNGAVEGTFSRIGAALAYAARGWGARLEVIGQWTPLETEAGGTLALTAALTPGMTGFLSAGRTTRDPVFGAEGTTTLSAGVAVRLVAWSPPSPPPVVAVEEARTGGRLVRFSVRAPDAERVEVTGDFSGWEPVAMSGSGGRWEVALVLEPGLHHFGFLIDGQWAIPSDAPGVVDDGWGRKNASIVVDP